MRRNSTINSIVLKKRAESPAVSSKYAYGGTSVFNHFIFSHLFAGILW